MLCIISQGELNPLRQWQFRSKINSIGLPPHVGFPGIGARLAAATGFLFTAKCPAYFGTRRTNIDIGNAAIGALVRQKLFGFQHIG